MKVRTKLELQELLNRDLSWRRMELTSILSAVSISQGKNHQLNLRTSTLLLYAHWEGFVKKAAELYLIYVRSQNLKLNELDHSFLAIAMKQKIKVFEDTNKSTLYTQFVKDLRSDLNDDCEFSTENVITAGSNLNSTVLRQILTCIGIDFEPFELKSNLIDHQLLKYRNTIAHGEFLQIDADEYKIIHKEIVNMINEVKNRIENCAALESFRLTKYPLA